MSLLPTDAQTAAAPIRSQATKPSSRRLLSSPQWLRRYDDFVAKNASQVARIESGLRSLTYILPGRFHDAEMASETIHSGVQLLSLYHDRLLDGALASSSSSSAPVPTAASPPPSAHARYTRAWTRRSVLYRRVATLLQVVRYTELLCEMAAKRRGDGVRWRVVVLIEGIKAFCRLVLLYITRLRPVVTPALPERQSIPDPADAGEEAEEGQDYEELLAALKDDDGEEEDSRVGEQGREKTNGVLNGPPPPPPRHLRPSSKPWPMPRTGLSLPRLPKPGDTASYLLSHVLTADDIKPARKLLQPLRPYSAAHAAELLHILTPVVYALMLAGSQLRSGGGGAASTHDSRGGGRRRLSWTPWLVGVALELAARRLREHDFDGGRRPLRATALQRAEWSGRGVALGWWAMRGAFYETFTRGLVEGVRGRMPGFVGTVMQDYEYLWENYYFSTSS